MFDKLEILQMAQSMASHASVRQSVVAQNIANADTPFYRARDVASFADTYEKLNGDWSQRATRDGHLAMGSDSFKSQVRSVERNDAGTMSPNGNSVSLELEMVNAVEVKRQHDRALTIYRYSLDMLRTSLGRGR